MKTRVRCFLCGWQGEIDPSPYSIEVIDCPNCKDPSFICIGRKGEAEQQRELDNIDLVSAGDYIMPFGKYEGKKLSEVPLLYLDWLMGLSDLREPLKSSLEKYMIDPTILQLLKEEL